MKRCQEFEARIFRLGLTTSAYAHLIGVSTEALRNWSGHGRFIPEPEWAVRQLRLFEEQPECFVHMKGVYLRKRLPRGKSFKKAEV
jgi:DNA-binding transcriptional regulator YiaG